jgi:hypothetical protein
MRKTHRSPVEVVFSRKTYNLSQRGCGLREGLFCAFKWHVRLNTKRGDFRKIERGFAARPMPIGRGKRILFDICQIGLDWITTDFWNVY